MGFLNISLIELLNFSQFIKDMENWDFCVLAQAVLPNFSQFTKEMDFSIPVTFIFRQIAGPVLESKGMHAIFQKKEEKGQKRANYLKILENI